MKNILNILIILIILLISSILIYIHIDKNTYRGTKSGKYFLGLGAIFKNESHILREWIEHNKSEGFDHIYLVNDHSNDNYMEILKPYLDSGYISLYHIPDKYKTSTQQKWAMSKIYYSKAIKECDWFIHLDLDEFISSRDTETTREKIEKFKDYDFIIIPWLLFGSDGVEKIPESAVETFTKRMEFNYNPKLSIVDNILVKTLYRSSKVRWYLNFIRVHSPYTNGKYILSSLNDKFKLKWGTCLTNAKESELENYQLVINHYRLQSREFWKTKTNRGDVHSLGLLQNRNDKKFEYLNKFYNQINDTNLRDKTRLRKRKEDIK